MQALFAEHQGLRYAQTQIDSLSARDNGVAASVTCQDNACTRLSIKVQPQLCMQPVSASPANLQKFLSPNFHLDASCIGAEL